ncbi:hypothetical protein LNKW23_23860 [Paralimibaculum aggregatum]|uniref:Uncharacterized protein n=1 Tax=Paralimibaculum aggregatum TaxID=3036245 RepID=A0ABQ6LPE6_9RHOB|nr:hypothetical protein [Limibaculum sp. NKW23]GMG83173.1 hypothetical protein LNKW23_23860 [Limibaculum sp. NKW23]
MAETIQQSDRKTRLPNCGFRSHDAPSRDAWIRLANRPSKITITGLRDPAHGRRPMQACTRARSPCGRREYV